MQLPTFLTGTVQTRAYAILREQVYNVLGKYDITPSDWAMLGVIFEARDGVRQTEVAKSMNVKPPLITVMVRRLETRGIIQTVQNQFDARAKLLSLTVDGKKLMKNAENELHKQLQSLLFGLTEDELNTYFKVLNTIIVNSKNPS